MNFLQQKLHFVQNAELLTSFLEAAALCNGVNQT